MVVYSLRPPVQVDKPVDGGQLTSQLFLTLGVGHGVDTPDVVDGHHAGGGGVWRRRKISVRLVVWEGGGC